MVGSPTAGTSPVVARDNGGMVDRSGPRRLRVAGILIAALALAGCTVVTGGSATGPAPASSASARSSSKAPLAHVVIIVMENKPSSRILGSASAPYLNALARRWAQATHYEAIGNPSLPNYLAMTSGTTSGITTDCAPDACDASVRTIATAITASGRDWRMYAESMPEPCTKHDADRYGVRHNPFLYDPKVTGDDAVCAQHDVPFDRFGADLAANRLPDYAFVSPDLCNDMHDCDVATGDRWLSRTVPRILGSAAFRSTRSLLVVTFDEGVREDNRVVTVLAGSAAKAGARSSRAYSHYSLLRTIEDAWGIPPLTANDAGATAMTDLLR
jgi:hypothetical protein